MRTNTVGSGIFYRNSKIGIKDIRDGSTHTLLVGERATRVPGGRFNTRAASIFGVNENDVSLSVYRGVFYVTGSVNQPINGGTTEPQGDYDQAVERNRGFSSQHPGGIHFVFADGSVKWISEHIDETTYENLANRNDGQVIGEYD